MNAKEIGIPTLTENRKSILLVISLVVAAAVLHYGSVEYMRKATDDKFEHIRTTESIFLNTSQIIIPDSTAYLKSLKNQFIASQEIEKYYFDVASTYYRNYYTFSICSIVFGTFLAIATFIIIGKGWENSSKLAKTFFLASVLISSFYFLLPNVLKNEENYQDNLAKVKVFNQIQMRILSFSTQPYATQPDSLSVFLSRTYKTIGANFDLGTVKIDSEKIGTNPQSFLNSSAVKKQ